MIIVMLLHSRIVFIDCFHRKNPGVGKLKEKYLSIILTAFEDIRGRRKVCIWKKILIEDLECCMLKCMNCVSNEESITANIECSDKIFLRSNFSDELGRGKLSSEFSPFS